MHCLIQSAGRWIRRDGWQIPWRARKVTVSTPALVIGGTFDEPCTGQVFPSALKWGFNREDCRFTLLAQMKFWHHVREDITVHRGWRTWPDSRQFNLFISTKEHIQRRNVGLRDAFTDNTPHDICVKELSGGLTVWRPYGLPRQHCSSSVNSWLFITLCHSNATHSKRAQPHCLDVHKTEMNVYLTVFIFSSSFSRTLNQLSLLLKGQITSLRCGIYCTHSLYYATSPQMVSNWLLHYFL